MLTQKKAGGAVLISDMADLRTRKIIRDKERQAKEIDPPRRYNNPKHVCT